MKIDSKESRMRPGSWRWEGVPWYLRSGKLLPGTAPARRSARYDLRRAPAVEEQ